MPDTSPAIVVTRCGGLIGSRLVQALSGDVAVVGLDAEPPKPPASGLSDSIECDPSDEAGWRRAWARVVDRHGRRLVSVVHLGVSGGGASGPAPLPMTPDPDEVRELLEALNGFDLEQLVLESSLLAMKPAEAMSERIDEGSALRSSAPEAERLVHEHGGAPHVTVLRRARVYDDDGHSPPIGHQIGRIKQNPERWFSRNHLPFPEEARPRQEGGA